jgi:hypothetical protein
MIRTIIAVGMLLERNPGNSKGTINKTTGISQDPRVIVCNKPPSRVCSLSSKIGG